jgi:hypothetical protein
MGGVTGNLSASGAASPARPRGSGVGWFQAKARVIRDAVRRYLEAPWYRLPERATAQLPPKPD